MCLGFVHIPDLGLIPFQIIEQKITQRCFLVFNNNKNQSSTKKNQEKEEKNLQIYKKRI